MVLQQALKGPQTLGQALAVVQPIHPQQQAALGILLAQGGQHVLCFPGPAQGLELVDIDADRHGPGAHVAAEGMEDVVVAALGARFVVHVAGKVRQVDLALKTDQVIGKQRTHQPFVLRNGGHDLRRRQRDVQEEPHALLAAQRPQLGGQWDQVVVVDPYQVVGPQQGGQPVGDQAVDAAIAIDLAPVQVGQVEPVMEHRPQHAVGVAQVIGVVIGLRQVDRGQRGGPGTLQPQRRVGARFPGRHHLPAPAEPQPARGRQRVTQGHGQSACSALAWVGHAVGHDHQAGHQITVSQGADSRTAPLIRPTIE